MIKREHIKQAIEAISKRDTHVGASLDRMLSMGLIGVPDVPRPPDDEENLYFLFDGEKVRINKVLYFNEGTVPIEQGLLVKYGEIYHQQELQGRGRPFSYRKAFSEIREAGLRLLVDHEIDYALQRLKKRAREPPGFGGRSRRGPLHRVARKAALSKGGDSPVQSQEAVSLLEKIRGADHAPGFNLQGHDVGILFQGAVANRVAAFFIPFPLCLEGLMQVADINLEFFHVRFILDCLIRGTIQNLFACVAGRRILGLAYVVYSSHLFGKDLEIRYLSSLGGRAEGHETQPPSSLKGIGTFLLAGLWMLAKNERSDVGKIFLDAELGARTFYEALGFESMGPTRFQLKQPDRYLMKGILTITHHVRDLRSEVIREVEKLLRDQIRALRKRKKGRNGKTEREIRIAIIKECFSQDAHPEFSVTAANGLLKYEREIPESREILLYAVKNASDRVKAHIQHATGTCYQG